MKIFIPYRDDQLEQWADEEPLVPYQAGYLLLSQIAEPEPEEAISRDAAPAGPREPHPAPLPSPR